jgi:hypothetical protein
MFSLSCTAEASTEPREARHAAGSLVVLDGAGVFMSTLVSKDRCASGLTFAHVVVEGGAIRAAAG